MALTLGRTSRGRGAKSLDAKAEAFLDEQTRLIRLQTEHLHEQRQVILSRLRWGRYSDRMKALLQTLTVLVGVAIVIVVAVMAWTAHEDHSLVIESFSTPPALAQQGLTGQALASEMMDHVSTIARVGAADSISRASQVRADQGNEIKVEIPETGLSLTEAWRALRDLIGGERKIEGELRQDADGLVLTVRVEGQDAITVRGGAGDLDALEQKAAEQVFAATDPSDYALYLDASGRIPEAIAVARHMIVEDGSTYFAFWSTLEHGVDPVRALQLAKLAVGADPRSPYTWFELLRAEGDLGHAQGELTAALKLRERMQLSPSPDLSGRGGDYLRALARRTIDELAGDYAGSLRVVAGRPQRAYTEIRVEDEAFLHDIASARSSLAAARMAGMIAAGASARAGYFADAAEGDWAAAAADARALIAADDDARAKDPVPDGMAGLAEEEGANDTPLLAEAEARLGQSQASQALISSTPLDAYDAVRGRGRVAAAMGDWVAADRWFAEAARQGTSLPLAYADWGEALLAKGDVAGAIAKLQLAHLKGPRFADPLELWGDALLAKGDVAGAISKFAEADKDAPKWGRNHLRWGEALMLSGRYAEAR
ncbi:MAG TPA: hypothetical protein VHX64_14230, partial [Caulobacteraceae bacterium]|nr:hypothetical protein [Caulobacteraceae bacterium]